MKNQYQKLLLKLQQSKDQLAQYQQDKAQAEATLSHYGDQIAQIEASVKSTLLAGGNADKELEQREALEREATKSRLLIEAFSKAIPEQESLIQDTEQCINDELAALARRWLSSEVDRYQKAYDALVSSLQRLSAAARVLQNQNLLNVYRDMVGAYRYLQGTKVFPIQNFVPQGDKPWTRFVESPSTQQQVLAEIEEDK